MGRTVVEQPVEGFLVRWLLVRYVNLVDNEQIPLRPVKCRCIGQIVLANHLHLQAAPGVPAHDEGISGCADHSSL